MKNNVYLACAMTAVLTGCAGPAAQAPVAANTTTAAASQIEVKLVQPPAAFSVTDDRAKLVFVEFTASPAVTAELRQALAAAGYQLTESRTQASVTYDIDGAFQALRPATNRTAEIRAGDYAEKPGPVATKTGRGNSIFVSANPVAMVLGTLASNAGTRTGARDATNNATVGDPDGKCLNKCEGWLYRQRAVINVQRTEGGVKTTTSAMASVTAPALQPCKLFARSYADIAGATGMPRIERLASFAKQDEAQVSQ